MCCWKVRYGKCTGEMRVKVRVLIEFVTVSVLMEYVLCECADGTCVTVSVLMESMLVSKR